MHGKVKLRLALLIPTIALSIWFFPPFLFVVGAILAAEVYHGANSLVPRVKLEPWINDKWKELYERYGQRKGLTEEEFLTALDKVGECRMEAAFSLCPVGQHPGRKAIKFERRCALINCRSGQMALKRGKEISNPPVMLSRGTVELQHYDRSEGPAGICLHTEYRIKYTDSDLYAHVFVYAENE